MNGGENRDPFAGFKTTGELRGDRKPKSARGLWIWIILGGAMLGGLAGPGLYAVFEFHAAHGGRIERTNFERRYYQRMRKLAAQNEAQLDRRLTYLTIGGVLAGALAGAGLYAKIILVDEAVGKKDEA